MSWDENSVSAVIPVHNEEDHLEPLLQRCLAAGETLEAPFEIVLVDDGSTDRSAEILRQAVREHPEQVVAVILNRNYGQHAAVMAGFEHARGGIVVTLDADLQNPPEEIPRVVAESRKGFDVVGTVRRNREDTLFRRAASRMVNWVVWRATGVRMRDYGCMLRAYRRPIVDAMLRCNEHSTFIPVLANTFARNATEIEVAHEARPAGRSRYTLTRLINLQLDLLTSMTTFPLRVLSVLGVLISVLGCGFGVFLLIMRLMLGADWAAEGVFTLFAILFIFIGAQFVGLGMLGEYIGRIYSDVRARPLYFVSEVRRGDS
jgi:undecaprenyl-phosphate 4-deoxy-4-formamido-L-arabinose transferase